MTVRAVLLVGECNPFGADPRLALYHLPRRSSGNRLREILGLDDADYLDRLERINLCSGRWSLPRARQGADRAAADPDLPRVWFCLGARVRAALSGPGFFEAARTSDGRLLLGLPHPSGLSRVWNDPTAASRARAAAAEAAPDVEDSGGWRPRRALRGARSVALGKGPRRCAEGLVRGRRRLGSPELLPGRRVGFLEVALAGELQED